MVFATLFSILFHFIALFLVLLTVLLLLFRCCLNKILFKPTYGRFGRKMEDNPKRFRSPDERGLPYENIYVNTDDGKRLHGWLMLQKDAKNSKTPTIIYLHENAGNLGVRLPYIEELYKKVGCNILMVAYRGYSYSEGSPSESGLKQDGHAIVQFALQLDDQLDVNNIYLMGKSLSSAVATEVASTGAYPLRGLILENPFPSLQSLLKHHFPKLSVLSPVFLTCSFNASDPIASIPLPILFISAERDSLIPASLRDFTIERAEQAKDKVILEIRTESHGGTYQAEPQRYMKGIKDFLAKRYAQVEMLI